MKEQDQIVFLKETMLMSNDAVCKVINAEYDFIVDEDKVDELYFKHFGMELIHI